MGSDKTSLLCQLKELVNQIDESCCSPPPPPAPVPVPVPINPYAQVTITTPPPGPLPTNPAPIRPLQLPPYPTPPQPAPGTTEEAFKERFANFYNNYNYDWRAGDELPPEVKYEPPGKRNGMTLDGGSPYCTDKKAPDPSDGCPTGFAPCTMEMIPPPNCSPCGTWVAHIQKCRPKSKLKY